jgi:hypothetical protein
MLAIDAHHHDKAGCAAVACELMDASLMAQNVARRKRCDSNQYRGR